MATSELNQFLENVDENVLECTICFKRIQNPKSLNCLHSFCLACLEDWVKKKGKLTCPTCSKSYPFPEGGLQKLPPNTFINNLLETIEQFSETDQTKCACKKGEAAIYYCRDCEEYLCSTCGDHHQILPMSANQKPHSVVDVRSKSTLQIAALNPEMCSLHNEPLKLFCCVCNVPICMHCTITVHNAWEGEHKPISISKAYEEAIETLGSLKKSTQHCKHILQDGLNAVIQNAINLQESKDKSLRDINEHVQTMINKIKENEVKMKNEVEILYRKKQKVLDIQMNELKATISDINTKLGFLDQLLKSNELRVIQSSQRVITTMNDRINELPKTKPNDNGQIYFFINKEHSVIGYVSHIRAADYLKLQGQKSVTQGQKIVVNVPKTDECEINVNQLKATWTQPTGETYITQVEEDDNGDYFVKGKCTSPGVCKIHVTADGEQIKQSPMIIEVEKKGLVKTINMYYQSIYQYHTNLRDVDVIKTPVDVITVEDDCLLVSCGTNAILKYKQSGKYISKITLPQGMKVMRMYKMENGNIVFSDFVHKCIMVCDTNGQIIKSIGQSVLKSAMGVYVDEASSVVYVADTINGLYMIDFVSGQMIRNFGPKSSFFYSGKIKGVTDVFLTNQGNILSLEFDEPHRLQLFDNEGRFIKVLVEAGDENGEVKKPRRVIVDEDDNIIILSERKLQLLSNNGSFIKRIDKQEDGINDPLGLCIISYHPRTVAVANKGDKTIKIFNY